MVGLTNGLSFRLNCLPMKRETTIPMVVKKAYDTSHHFISGAKYYLGTYTTYKYSDKCIPSLASNCM